MPHKMLPPKKDVALALLERGSVLVHLDPRMADVVVPSWFRKQPRLVLHLGLNMAVPIHDLRVDDEGMSCTLSFNRTPFFCFLPWTAVFALIRHDAEEGMVWPEDVPKDLALQNTEADASPRAPVRPQPQAAKAKKVTKKPQIALVPSPPKERRENVIPLPTPAAPPPPPRLITPGKKPRRELPPYLRVVK
ncbi:MAG: ClpXP protease specificity-enhancing factor SspB [Myxococcales bacterium]